MLDYGRHLLWRLLYGSQKWKKNNTKAFTFWSPGWTFRIIRSYFPHVPNAACGKHFPHMLTALSMPLSSYASWCKRGRFMAASVPIIQRRRRRCRR